MKRVTSKYFKLSKATFNLLIHLILFLLKTLEANANKQERIVTKNGKNYFGVLASDLWGDIGTTAATEGGIKFPNGKKPEKLWKRIIEMTTEPQDLVLDFFLGSGTTAAVAHKLGRQYIGIEQTDYQDNDCTVRLQNVINGDSTGISKSVGWQGGGVFVFGELGF